MDTSEPVLMKTRKGVPLTDIKRTGLPLGLEVSLAKGTLHQASCNSNRVQYFYQSYNEDVSECLRCNMLWFFLVFDGKVLNPPIYRCYDIKMLELILS